MRCWKRSPLGKPLRFHRCTRFLNAVCKCKMCTSALPMDGQRWFRCRWWSVDSPLHPHRHRCRWLTWDRPHPLLWTSIWRHHHRLHPLQRQLLVVRHLHGCPWSSGPSLPVVDSLLALSMPREAASSSPAITQMGWPHLPPPIGGPNGPRSGRHAGCLGGGGGARRGMPRRGRSARAPAAGTSGRSARAPAAGTRGRSALARHQRGLRASTRFGMARAASSQAAAAACWPGVRATCCVARARARDGPGRPDEPARSSARAPTWRARRGRPRRLGTASRRRLARVKPQRLLLGAGGWDFGTLAAAAGKAPVGDDGWGRLGLETLAAPI
jgi:hypothetical protein